jgi:multidrug efflux pump subunit AcrB
VSSSGSKDYDFIGRYNGKEATLVGIFLQPGANALEVAKTVRTTMTDLSSRFPQGLAHSRPYDTTRFVEVSIKEVVFTLGEAMILVFLVVLPVPAELARDDHPARRGAGVAARRVRRGCRSSATRSTR